MNKIQIAEQFRRALQMFAASLGEEQAMEVATVYDGWVADKAYAVGQYVTYGKNGVGDPQLYQVLQDHTSQADWTPDVSVSLFAKVLIPDEDVIPEWEQPDSTNAYMTGDKVMYDGKVYMSTIDNNIWAPDAYPAGWKIVEE